MQHAITFVLKLECEFFAPSRRSDCVEARLSPSLCSVERSDVMWKVFPVPPLRQDEDGRVLMDSVYPLLCLFELHQDDDNGTTW